MALRGTATHRKIRRLAKKLNIDPCFALGVVESIWHTTAEQQPDGGIGRLSNQDIADEIFYSGEADDLIDALTCEEVQLLDSAESCRLYVHDWHDWADDATVSKLVSRRQRFANGSIPRLTKYSQSQREAITAQYDEHEKATMRSMRNMRTVRTVRNMRIKGHGAHNAPRAGAPPVPVPDPVPVPVPDPDNKTSPADAGEKVPIFDDELRRVAKRIHQRHPAVRRCSYGETEKRLRQILNRHPKAERSDVLKLVDHNHEAFCGLPDWQKEGGTYAKGLDNWLAPTMERWKEPPDAMARDSPLFADRPGHLIPGLLTD